MSPSFIKKEKSGRLDKNPVYCSNQDEICQCQETGSVFMGEKISVVGGQDILDKTKPFKLKNFQALQKVPCDASLFDMPSGDCFCGTNYQIDKEIFERESIT